MKVITANVNGVRAAAKKGFFKWIIQQNADVICLQEIKAHEVDLAHDTFHLPGYHRYFHCAEKKGYSGVAIYCKQEPLSIATGLGWEIADKEGRYIEANFGKIRVASVYLPSGTSGEERQKLKMEFLALYEEILKKQIGEGCEYIICGDWNIAHKEVDLKNWRGNQKNSGFLPEERAWLDKIFGKEVGLVDAFRVINQAPDQYTWWSHRGQARAKNVGWRIDYQIVTPGLKDKIKAVSIYTEENFSDHAPLVVEYGDKE